MSGLFRRRSNIACFFCQSPIAIPPDPSNFRCPACQCWNRFDSKGEIMSFEPAMQDESLNRRSFSKRASPSKARLPTMYGKGPFCRTCQTNQMLLVNLLANYLPSPENPQYERRVAMLPEYRESLHTRYPPVCDECRPVVEDEIRRKDSMARVKALGGWLSETKGRDTRRRVSAPNERGLMVAELNMWRVRGCLWGSTLATAVFCDSIATMGYSFPRLITAAQPALPVFVLVSLLWTAWDPTYASYRRASIQGRDVRVHGKSKYNVFQTVAWLSRFITAILLSLSRFKPHLDFLHLRHHPTFVSRMYFGSCLIIELSVVIVCAFTLRLKRPPAIRLVDSKSHTHPDASVNDRSRSSTPFSNPGSNDSRSGSLPSNARPTPAPADMDLLASLSLSSKPVITPTNPVFGLPSLLASSSNAGAQLDALQEDHMDEDGFDQERDEMAMDWTPIRPSGRESSYNKPKGKQKSLPDDDDGTWLRPQRFFAPEKPTGLEGLFERTNLIDDSDGETRPQKRASGALIPRWTYALSIIPIILVFVAWRIGRGRVLPPMTDYPLPYTYHNSQHPSHHKE